eukprot:CAMPEP_0197662544 /NCGR_PEP_ID=MMETSP1338-20131121/53854_1 /TAXON_ID=43686 ORGANISM="Pelagodinium beii, Strain RCC1491" /NCGR_SAMPLE_ID=MMETSP1338 /ASSEMBLY_ACC=CAM_ASM_000754 /LENGTH=390 /DNA_ID=CAMNT_0043240439 /DNA_START=23 /DNA_END=1195 /DNA_ORIENTATION=+
MAAVVAAAVKKRNEAAKESPGTTAASAPNASPTPEPEIELPEEGTGIWKFQRAAAKFYIDSRVQWSVAGLIIGNFLFNILEKWIDPTATELTLLWDVIDGFFNVCFAIELCVNMYAFWLKRFWKSAWNVFDFVVVAIGLLFMSKVELPPSLGLLRLMRAFRVFRLFKRIKSLNKIMVAIVRCIPGVSVAFGMLFLVTAFYAIVGVEFFRTFGKDGHFMNEIGEEVPLQTARGFTYGDEYFGNFGRSMYTMFQVLTGESWSEAVARPLLLSNDPSLKFGAVVFFISFNLIGSIILINVVIAVLLEKMVDEKGDTGSADEERRSSKRSLKRSSDQGANSLMNGQDKQEVTVSTTRVAAIESDCTTVKGDLDMIKNQMDMVLKAVSNLPPTGM